jgi:hypothetical protein
MASDENKTELMQHVLKFSEFPCCVSIKSVFLHAFSHANAWSLVGSILHLKITRNYWNTTKVQYWQDKMSVFSVGRPSRSKMGGQQWGLWKHIKGKAIPLQAWTGPWGSRRLDKNLYLTEIYSDIQMLHPAQIFNCMHVSIHDRLYLSVSCFSNHLAHTCWYLRSVWLMEYADTKLTTRSSTNYICNSNPSVLLNQSINLVSTVSCLWSSQMAQGSVSMIALLLLRNLTT